MPSGDQCRVWSDLLLHFNPTVVARVYMAVPGTRTFTVSRPLSLSTRVRLAVRQSLTVSRATRPGPHSLPKKGVGHRRGEKLLVQYRPQPRALVAHGGEARLRLGLELALPHARRVGRHARAELGISLTRRENDDHRHRALLGGGNR